MAYSYLVYMIRFGLSRFRIEFQFFLFMSQILTRTKQADCSPASSRRSRWDRDQAARGFDLPDSRKIAGDRHERALLRWKILAGNLNVGNGDDGERFRSFSASRIRDRVFETSGKLENDLKVTSQKVGEVAKLKTHQASEILKDKTHQANVALKEKTYHVAEVLEEKTHQANVVFKDKTHQANVVLKEKTHQASTVLKEKTSKAAEELKSETLQASKHLKEITQQANEHIKDKTTVAVDHLKEETHHASLVIKNKKRLAKDVLKDKTEQASQNLKVKTKQTGKALKENSKKAGEALKSKTAEAGKALLSSSKTKPAETRQLTHEPTVQLTETKLDRDFVMVKQPRRQSESPVSGIISVEKLTEKSFPDVQRIESGKRRSLSRSRVEQAIQNSAKKFRKRARSAGQHKLGPSIWQ